MNSPINDATSHESIWIPLPPCFKAHKLYGFSTRVVWLTIVQKLEFMRQPFHENWFEVFQWFFCVYKGKDTEIEPSAPYYHSDCIVVSNSPLLTLLKSSDIAPKSINALQASFHFPWKSRFVSFASLEWQRLLRRSFNLSRALRMPLLGSFGERILTKSDKSQVDVSPEVTLSFS